MNSVLCVNDDNTITLQQDGTILQTLFSNGANQRGTNVAASGADSHASGVDTTASAEASFAHGFATDGGVLEATADGAWSLGWAGGGATLRASGVGAHVEGMTESNGRMESAMPGAHVEGCAIETSVMEATAKGAHVEGYAQGASTMVASGLGAHVEGWVDNALTSEASGDGSHAEGYATLANATAAHAEGWKTQATGLYSHAEGYGSGSILPPETNFCKFEHPGLNTVVHPFDGISSGNASHTEGWTTQALAKAAHAEGDSAIARGISSHAEGVCTWAYGDNSHSEGGTIDGDFITFQCRPIPSLPSGYTLHGGCYAIGDGSHAEGICGESVGEGAHSEGIHTLALGVGAHSEGIHVNAEGTGSHAEGFGTKSIGVYSHAEGHNTVANGDHSHAEGDGSGAFGSASHAGGVNTNAQGAYSFTMGLVSETTLSASASVATGAYSNAYYENMWSHGFLYNPPTGGDYKGSQVLKYTQHAITLHSTPSINVSLPVLGAVPNINVRLWCGTVTITARSSYPKFALPEPRLFVDVYDVVILHIDGGTDTIQLFTQHSGYPITIGTWALPPALSPVIIGTTQFTLNGHQAYAGGTATFYNIYWSIVWEVVEI